MPRSRFLSMALILVFLGACGGKVIVDGQPGSGAGGAGGATAVTSASSNVSSTGTGMGSGPKLMIYSNYDGGSLTINVDTPVPQIIIGLVSYESMTVKLQGPYVGNVIAVDYAGYDDTPGKTTVTGVDPSIVTIMKSPTATLSQPGFSKHIDCNDKAHPASTDGCNSAAQVEAYFVDHHSGSIAFHKCQYEAYKGAQNVSAGGACK